RPNSNPSAIRDSVDRAEIVEILVAIFGQDRKSIAECPHKRRLVAGGVAAINAASLLGDPAACCCTRGVYRGQPDDAKRGRRFENLGVTIGVPPNQVYVSIAGGCSPKNNSVVGNKRSYAGRWLKVASGELLLDAIHPFCCLHPGRGGASRADDD